MSKLAERIQAIEAQLEEAKFAIANEEWAKVAQAFDAIQTQSTYAKYFAKGAVQFERDCPVGSKS